MKTMLLKPLRASLIFIFTSLVFCQLQAQDRIIKQTGDTVYCKIVSLDNENLLYKVKQGDSTVNKSISRGNVLDYRYQYKYTNTSKYRTDTLKALDILLIYKRANGKPVKILKKDGKHVTPIELDVMLQNDMAAYSLYKSAKKSSKACFLFIKVGTICLGASAGYLVGSSLGQAASSQTTTSGQTSGTSSTDPAAVSASLACIGAACIAVGIAMKPNINKKLFKALKIHNNTIRDQQ
jgi:hypothetical protein